MGGRSYEHDGVARSDSLEPVNHPLFKNGKLKFGASSINPNGAYAILSINRVRQADWASTLNFSQMADAMEFEGLAGVGICKSFGGITNLNNAGVENVSSASATAILTRNAGAFATTRGKPSDSVDIIKECWSSSLAPL